MEWIYAIPTWIFAVGTIGLGCGLAAIGLARFDRSVSASSLTHNDVAGPIFTTIGTILAVMLSFMVITVWQEFDLAAGTVQSEAAALGDLYHLCEQLPASFSSPLRSDITLYARAVVEREWPAMQQGKFSSLARARAHAIARQVASFRPKSLQQSALLAAMLTLTNRFFDARRQRLFDNDQSIPPILWAAMLFIAAITISSTYFFHVQSRPAHYVMTILLTATIISTMVVIAELDLPFRGDIHIPPTSFIRTRLSANANL